MSPVPSSAEPAAPAGPPGGGAFEAVVLAASLGGLGVLRQALGGLPPGFPAAMLIVQHRSPGRAGSGADSLAAVLDRHSTLPVGTAVEGDPLLPGRAAVVPPRTSLRLDGGGLIRLRPAGARRMADPTLEALSERFGPRLLVAVLTGLLDDGAAGARSVKAAGGRILVQDPADAAAPAMPTAVLATGCVDLVVPASRLAAALTALVMAPGGAGLLHVPTAAWARPAREGQGA
ncbi:chemotaxis protein CheB [Actinomadura sp. 21ATH]|uniref:chemotaxis protein CheB n=1 Tax=Actinomadura sp. 21ATH TaxID=1735444 RepID=UPI0035C14651